MTDDIKQELTEIVQHYAPGPYMDGTNGRVGEWVFSLEDMFDDLVDLLKDNGVEIEME